MSVYPTRGSVPQQTSPETALGRSVGDDPSPSCCENSLRSVKQPRRLAATVAADPTLRASLALAICALRRALSGNSTRSRMGPAGARGVGIEEPRTSRPDPALGARCGAVVESRAGTRRAARRGRVRRRRFPQASGLRRPRRGHRAHSRNSNRSPRGARGRECRREPRAGVPILRCAAARRLRFAVSRRGCFAASARPHWPAWPARKIRAVRRVGRVGARFVGIDAPRAGRSRIPRSARPRGAGLAASVVPTHAGRARARGDSSRSP